MTSSTTLLKRAERLKRDLEPIQPGRSYSMTLFDWQEISPDLLAKLNYRDTLFIKRICGVKMNKKQRREKEVMGQIMSCWVKKGGKKVPCVVRTYGVDISKV